MTLEIAAFLLAILLPALGGAVTWGALTTRLRVLEEKQRSSDKQLKDSREAQGARLGRLERWQAFLQGANAHRKPSAAYPVLPEQPEEESGATSDE